MSGYFWGPRESLALQGGAACLTPISPYALTRRVAIKQTAQN
ncbi:hypothetical protein D921_00657 [Enterococcus faecalis F01966]|nr:hypothetical protein D921_00657 [Enterococcus faecalis F01966]